MWRGLAPSSEATWCTSVSASPATRPPRRSTICPSVNGPGMQSLRGRLALLERLDHLVGDVDARAREDGVLEDDVELFLLGDLPDDAVRLLDHLRQLLVAALVEILAELALLALVVAVLEFRFDLFLRALRGRGVTQDALGVDEAELARRHGCALLLRERRDARQ